MKPLFLGPILGLGILLGACGGSSAPVVQPSTFPNAQNLPTLQIKDRVINLNSKSGFQYAKMSLNVKFNDPKGEFRKAKGEGLKKLQETFVADNPAAVAAFDRRILAGRFAEVFAGGATAAPRPESRPQAGEAR